MKFNHLFLSQGTFLSKTLSLMATFKYPFSKKKKHILQIHYSEEKCLLNDFKNATGI